MTRCPSCFRRVDTMHRAIGRCPGELPTRPQPRARRGGSQRGYTPPSRSHRTPRAEYLDSVRVDPEVKRANRRLWEAEYRAKKREPNA